MAKKTPESKGTQTRTIRVEQLARVEGEGGMTVRVKNGRVEEVQLRIYEPPRFFEAFLRGRRMEEVPDITARICGICPVAYQMSACHAIEDACGVRLDGPLRELRRLLYCGEWIESHALHVYMLHAPDFLGYPSAIALAQDHPDTVKQGLRLKKAGNAIVELLGGREIHPVNVRVGGFYRAPSRSELNRLLDELVWAREAALETVRWVADFDFPDFERDYELVSLSHPDEYPYCEGDIVSSRGMRIPLCDYNDTFEERHVRHSNALQSVIRERGAYLVGPLARYGLNFDRLHPSAQKAAQQAGLGKVCKNPFQSIVVRAVEIVQAVEEALRVIRSYREPERPFVPLEPREAVGHGCTEAPRGMLYHRYAINAEGLVEHAQIVPPTSQNQPSIEQDLTGFVQDHLALNEEELTLKCEQAIRNYDPCISCATHFLKLELERT